MANKWITTEMVDAKTLVDVSIAEHRYWDHLLGSCCQKSMRTSISFEYRAHPLAIANYLPFIRYLSSKWTKFKDSLPPAVKHCERILKVQ